MGPARSRTVAVGRKDRPSRTRSGSPTNFRIRARDALMAGWPTESLSAARVRLHSAINATGAHLNMPVACICSAASWVAGKLSIIESGMPWVR